MSRIILSAFSDSSFDMFCFSRVTSSSVSGSVNWILFVFAAFMVPRRNGIISLMFVGFSFDAKFIKNCSFSGDIFFNPGLFQKSFSITIYSFQKCNALFWQFSYNILCKNSLIGFHHRDHICEHIKCFKLFVCTEFPKVI